MKKTIAVSYTSSADGQPVSIPLEYEREDQENILVIRCKVDLPPNQIPSWLKPHKFEVRALYDGNSYEVLINETKGVHNLDAALFMEKVQAQVFMAEKKPALAKAK